MDGLKMLVLDASVALKLVVEEPGTAQAFALLDLDEKRIAPDWLLMEAAAALWNKVKYSALLEIHAERSLQDMPRFFHQLVSSSELIDATFRLSFRLRHSVYDCIYLALAIRDGARLITADKEFFRAIKRVELANHAQLLEW